MYVFVNAACLDFPVYSQSMPMRQMPNRTSFSLNTRVRLDFTTRGEQFWSSLIVSKNVLLLQMCPHIGAADLADPWIINVRTRMTEQMRESIVPLNSYIKLFDR
jgi:hypothetical protein